MYLVLLSILSSALADYSDFFNQYMRPTTPYHRLTHNGDYITVDLEIGTPPQKQTVTLDTDSVDLWVFSNGTGAPTMFNNYESSTIEFVDKTFFDEYYGYFTAGNDFYKDVVTWDNSTIRAQFGLDTGAYSAFDVQGVFGLGMKNTDYGSIGHNYDSYPYALRDQGKINTAAYSLSMASKEILFGAVDLMMFSGPLKRLPFLSNSSALVEFEFNDHVIQGVLHGGVPTTYFPDDVYHMIAQSIGMTYNNTAQTYTTTNLSTSLTLNFGGLPITIPPYLLLTEIDGIGYLNIQSEPNGMHATLGDTFLEAIYVVYDLENRQAAIAQSSVVTGKWGIKMPRYLNITEDGIPFSF